MVPVGGADQPAAEGGVEAGLISIADNALHHLRHVCDYALSNQRIGFVASGGQAGHFVQLCLCGGNGFACVGFDIKIVDGDMPLDLHV